MKFNFAPPSESSQDAASGNTRNKRSRVANGDRSTRSTKRQRTSPPPPLDENSKDTVASPSTSCEAEANNVAAGPSAPKSSADSHHTETTEATSSSNGPTDPAKPNDAPDAESPPPGDARSSWKPYEEFYFNDGDIILRSNNDLDNTIFRVHRNRLRALGGFFADVIQVTQSQYEDDDLYDDCQILALPFDFISSFDIIQLLKYIYHETIIGRTVECEWPHGRQEQRFMVNVDMALSLTLIGRTLSLGSIRNEAAIMARHVFPYTAAEYNDPEPLFTGPSSEEREFTRKTYAIRAIRVFKECNLHLFLPLAYYFAAQLDDATLENPVPYYHAPSVSVPLDSEDIKTIKDGRAQLKSMKQSWLDSDTHSCDKPLCCDVLRECDRRLKRLGYYERPDALLRPQLTLFEHTLCSTCNNKIYKRRHKQIVSNFDSLPECFGLDWEDLSDPHVKEDTVWREEESSLEWTSGRI